MCKNRSPLIMTYGAGHAQISSALSKAFIEDGIVPNIIGLTTAYKTLKDQDIPVKSVTELLDYKEDQVYLESVEPYLDRENHPDITREQTAAYLAIGLHGLSDQIGFEPALELFSQKGRKCFEPVSIMRRYLNRTNPSIVITTSSPRFELAMLKAAKSVGIPSLAVSDYFLQSSEKTWILGDVYADHLTVIHENVRQMLIQEGIQDIQLHVTGNPAFDQLAPQSNDEERRNATRSRLGLSDKKVILWPAAASTHTFDGQRLTSPEEVAATMEKLIERNPNLTYILRPHPNLPFDLPQNAKQGILDNGLLTVEDAILVSDIVLTEVSTVGLQACLRNKPVICVRFEDYALYPQYGWANAVSSWDDAARMIENEEYLLPTGLEGLNLGKASVTVMKLAQSIEQNHSSSQN